MKTLRTLLFVAGASLALTACEGGVGPAGPAGPEGTAGGPGAAGAAGATGDGCTAVDNMDGTYDVTCGGVTVTVSDGDDVDPAVLDAIQAQLDELVADVEPEQCAVCHSGDGQSQHQDIYNDYKDTSVLGLTITNVQSTLGPACAVDDECDDDSCDTGVCSGEYGATVTFQITKNGAPYVDAAGLPTLGQKRFIAATWDGTEFDRGGKYFGDFKTTGTAGTYTAVAGGIGADRGPLPWDPAATNGMVWGYVADTALDTEGGETMYDNVASASWAVGSLTPGTYTSAANVSACEKCHGGPYLKHAYRPAEVAGLDTFVACKGCHYDNRTGGHQDWQLLVDDPEQYAAYYEQTLDCPPGDRSCDGVTDFMTAAEKTRYAYTANLKNDVHMAHSMEFPFPQSMSTCATCHEGKLGDGTAGSGILDEANFVRETCKGCHAATGSDDWVDCTTFVDCDQDSDCDDGTCDNPDVNGDGECVGEDDNDCADGTCDNVVSQVGVCIGEDHHGTRRSSMEAIWIRKGVNGFHPTTYMTDTSPLTDCDTCHNTTTGPATTMIKDLHNGGYDPQIYTAAGDKYSEIFVGSIDDASFNSTTNILTVDFSITEGTPAVASLDPDDIVPTLMLGLYGYDTKQFIVYTHGRDANRERLLEIEIDDGVNTTHPRFTVVSATNGVYQVAADLTMWAQMITDGVVHRIEIGFMPELMMIVGDDDGSTTGDTCASPCLGDTHCEGTACVADDDYMLALDAPSETFDLSANDFGGAYPDVIDEAKCNDCHDALATTFHSPKRGGNIKICKMCHVSSSRGSHIEMQSRGIDSYVHAVHSFQVWDTGDIDFSDPVEVVHYEHHLHHTFPNFTIKNCEACHTPGSFNVPDQSKTLPAVISATDNVDRAIGSYPQMAVGPAANACGSCHRSHLINHDDAGGLAAFMSHLKSGGYAVEDSSGLWDTIVTKILSIFE